jgi:hypothetical protein
MNGDLEVMDWEALDDPELGDPYESDGFSDFEEALFEDDLEDEGFDGYDDMEFDPFLGSWIRKAKRAVSKVARGPIGGILKNLARKAATVAGGAIAGPAGASIASMIANRAIREEEYGEAYDYEDADFEDEYEALGGDPDVLAEMESLAEMAAETDNEEEADQFLGPLANLASSLLPSLLGEEEFGGDGYEGYDYEEGLDEEFLPFLVPLATSLLPKAIPLVKRGIQALGKMFHRNRRTRRHTIRALPKIAMKTNVQLAKQARRGVKLTPKRVAAALARQTVKTISTPRKLTRAAAPARVATRIPTAVRTAPRHMTRYARPRHRRIVRPRYCVY